MPTCASRARSAGAEMPLSSPTSGRSRGISGASASLVESEVSKVRRVAVVDADHRRTKVQRAVELGAVVDSISTSMLCALRRPRYRGRRHRRAPP